MRPFPANLWFPVCTVEDDGKDGWRVMMVMKNRGQGNGCDKDKKGSRFMLEKVKYFEVV